MNKKKVIIIGGGFAGLHLSKGLPANLFEVILIDKVNHHQFQPLFYQVASSRLEPSNISFPFRKILQKLKHINFVLGNVLSVDPKMNSVITDNGNYTYDHLVIATGCKTNFYGNKELETHSLTMKSTFEAITIRNQILLNLENAVTKKEDSFFNIVLVGGGPTGVELAGAFAEMKKNILPKDYPHHNFSKLKIILIEGSPNILNQMAVESQQASRKYLEELGVQLITNTTVKSYDGATVLLSSGELLACQNLIWAAGVTGNLLNGINTDAITKSNRYTVNRYNKVNDEINIFAIGDIALMKTEKYPGGHPQLANVAINQGNRLAKNLIAMVQQKPMKEYEYTDLGVMATVGKHKAVVELPFIKFSGYLAWFVWMFLHLMLILSVRNKLMIFINWGWNYLTNDNSLRLIFKNPKVK
ncbi:MAG: NAD(P)/FAD-dependent oxidoreductase [Bacteroidia bacterium]|nr:NAD(P)/FAD-dependent oxidoreductase [Bacteroidia bacterium]